MTDRPQLFDDARDLLHELRRAGVEYVVVGAHALASHGIVRATGDFDVLVRPSADNARRMVTALERFGAPLSAHGVTAGDFAREDMVYQIGLPPRRIDILTSITGVSFDAAWAGRILVSIDGEPVGVVGIDTLIANKRAMARPKDLADVQALERIGREGKTTVGDVTPHEEG